VLEIKLIKDVEVVVDGGVTLIEYTIWACEHFEES
jgi:hypothetical protein